MHSPRACTGSSVNAGSGCRTATTPVDASAANEPPNRPARGVRTRECSGQAVQGLRTQSALRCSAGRGPPHALHSQRGRRHRRWGRGGSRLGHPAYICRHITVPTCARTRMQTRSGRAKRGHAAARCRGNTARQDRAMDRGMEARALVSATVVQFERVSTVRRPRPAPKPPRKVSKQME